MCAVYLIYFTGNDMIHEFCTCTLFVQDYERKIEELQEMILKKQAEVVTLATSKWFY